MHAFDDVITHSSALTILEQLDVDLGLLDFAWLPWLLVLSPEVL